MLIGCIVGPDFESAKRQVEKANILCDGAELRLDLLKTSQIKELEKEVKGVCIVTEGNHSEFDDKTISSYHNFQETPHNLEEILEKLPPATIYKIATFANSITDSLRMLAFLKGKKNVIGLCMGPLGQITRILSPLFGNVFNFASIETSAAPGQLSAEELLTTYNYKNLNPSTQLFGLIGNPVSQSPSHRTHNNYFKMQGINAVYVKMPVLEEELSTFLTLAKEVGFKGLSVTIPYKEKLFNHIDQLEKEAEEIGAVNTLTFKEGKIYGANTDGRGGIDALEEVFPIVNQRIVILGAGGSAKALAYEAQKRGGKVTLLSRRFGNLDRIPEHDILINTTPINPSYPVTMDISFTKEGGLVPAMKMFEKQARGQFSRWLFREDFSCEDIFFPLTTSH